MSERILRALMQLFALVARVDEVSNGDEPPSEIQSSKGKEIIEAFLKTQLASSDINKYLNIFNERLNATRKVVFTRDMDKKRSARQSVKALKICAEINKELTQRQKIIVLIRMFEFIHLDGVLSRKELDFVHTVADSFNINPHEYELIKEFIDFDGDIRSEDHHLVYYLNKIPTESKAHFVKIKQLDSPLIFLYIKSIGSIFVRYLGKDELFMNGTVINADRIHLFTNGSTIRTTKTPQIYHGDLLSRIRKEENVSPISYELKNVIHKFRTGDFAVHKVNIAANGGNLIGIMGGSGTGKTSLLNIMNGRVTPKYGSIKINGIDLHDDHGQLQGVIGNISQDDLLLEELTVFQNLYYSAKLSMGGFSDAQITQKVVRILKQLGLYDIRYLKVGSAINKIISGGQRKRLNIAIELIREPSILFVDEPTSGLSSRDSEYIMGLLKEIALSGKLVFVVIHQPSSNTFKMFDRLIMMDEGGYPVYDGLPVNAIVHFKMYSYQGNAHESECSLCGNINADQIFDLLESEVIDEYGLETGKRKKEPSDWYELYLKNAHKFPFTEVNERPKAKFKLPNGLKQFLAYLARDFKSKLSNTQYLLMNGLVAPILAVVLSLFIKYYTNSEGSLSYSYFKNENIPQFIFIAVIVAIFLGLTVSAEEINRDKRILYREMYLKLSRSSYLTSKVVILFLISAIQSLLFAAISLYILDVKGMFLTYWGILFSTSCMANMAGLNISSAFNSAKVIYIIVPLMIIPQLLFSGVIVKYDKLHPALSEATKVPFIGNIMVSRWAYEALAVEHSTNNELENYFFKHKVKASESAWKKDYWVPEIRKQLRMIKSKDLTNDKAILESKKILINEINSEDKKWSNLECKNCEQIIEAYRPGISLDKELDIVDNFVAIVQLQSIRNLNNENSIIEKIKDSLGVEQYRKLQDKYQNESLRDLVTNSHEENKLIISDHSIYRNDEPIYDLPKDASFFGAHFYAPYKYYGKNKIRTVYANLAVIWLMTIIAYIILYYDILRKSIDAMQNIGSKLGSLK